MQSFPAFKRIPFTASAYAQMQEDLEHVLQEEQAILERLKLAREQGDLSENGAYKYAKFELGNVRRKMKRLQRLLQFGEVVQKAENPERVEFGTAVTIQSEEKTVTYTIVSKHESDPAKGLLSQESPLGSRLMGRSVGETVSLNLPSGSVQYTILSIE